MKCPIDQSSLHEIAVTMNFLAPVHIDVCAVCAGVWLDKGELPRLVSHFSSDHKNTYRDWLTQTSDGKTAPKDFWSSSERHCPKDGSAMSRHYTGLAHEVGVEQCSQCQGFWFDGSELFAVAKANEPNARLDGAVRGASSALYKELQDNYETEGVQLWDMLTDPKRVLPRLEDLLIHILAAMIVRR